MGRRKKTMKRSDEGVGMRTRQMQSQTGATDSGSLMEEACTDGNVATVRRMVKDWHSVHEATKDGQSLIAVACSHGHLQMVKMLLTKGARVDYRGDKGDLTPLMEASQGGYTDIVKLLLCRGADVNSQSSGKARRQTALHYACHNGHHEVARLLLQAGADVNAQSEYYKPRPQHAHSAYYTPLMLAADRCHVEAMRTLLGAGADIYMTCQTSHYEDREESALVRACRLADHRNVREPEKGLRSLETMKLLLEHGKGQGHAGHTAAMQEALMMMCGDWATNNAEAVKALLGFGAPVSRPAGSHESPMTRAIFMDEREIVRVLIEHGADVEERNDGGHTPLMVAAYEGKAEIVDLLLAHGADVNACAADDGETALIMACWGRCIEVAKEMGEDESEIKEVTEYHLELVQSLIQAGAALNARTSSGDTALIFAASRGLADVTEALLSAGAENEVEDGYGALICAALKGCPETVKLLIAAGADVNTRTVPQGKTALTFACRGDFLKAAEEKGCSPSQLSPEVRKGPQRLEIVKSLLQAGAAVKAGTQDAKTGLTYACEGGFTDITEVLLNAGAAMEQKTDEGYTPLVCAAKAGHLDTVKFLISQGAEVNYYTAMHVAMEEGHYCVVEYLLHHQATSKVVKRKNNNDEPWDPQAILQRSKAHCSSRGRQGCQCGSNERHGSSQERHEVVLTGFESLYQDQELCDVILVAEEQAFKAHRCYLAVCSPYFRSMFRGHFSESTEKEVVLRGITAEGLRLVLQYLYTGNLTLSSGNIHPVLEATTHLQVSSLQDLCEQYLKDRLSFHNSIQFLQLAEMFSLESAKDRIMGLIVHSFRFVAQTSGFPMLPLPLLCQVLGDDKLDAASELQVFSAALSWLGHDPAKKCYAARVLSHVRFGLMTAQGFKFVNKQLAGDKTLLQHCQSLLETANHLHANPLEHPVQVSTMTQPRRCSDHLILVGGTKSTDDTQFMNFDLSASSVVAETEFQPIGKMNWHHFKAKAAVLNNCLYVVGGMIVRGEKYTDELPITRAAYMYNPINGEWTQIASMNSYRTDFALVALTDGLVAVGGGESFSLPRENILSLAEMYNVHGNKWTSMPDLIHAVKDQAGCVLSGCIYASGGVTSDDSITDKVQCYDPVKRQWQERCHMNQRRRSHAMVHIPDTDKLLVCTGQTVGHNGLHVDSYITEVYHVTTDQWTRLSPMDPPGTHSAGVVCTNHSVYVVGGFSEDMEEVLDSVRCYDVDSDCWRMLDFELPQGLMHTQLVCLKIPEWFTYCTFSGYSQHWM